MPPRAGKSEGISFWFLVWLMEMFPEMRVILCSYAAELATEYSARVRDELISNPMCSTKISKVQAQKHHWKTTKGGRFVAAGVGGGITGKGFDVGIIDDPLKNWEEAHSPTTLKKQKNWYGSTFYTRREPNASIIIIMTRWAVDDLAGWLEHDNPEDFEVIRFPAIAEANDILGREVGEALCPERQSIEELERTKLAVGSPLIWAGLYQQRPTADEGGIFQLDWFKTWDRLPVPDRIFQSWDMTFGSTSDSASWVVGQVWVEANNKYYLVYQTRGRWELPQTIEQVKRLAKAYPSTTHTLIENKAHGSAVMQQLKDELINPIYIEPKEYGNKLARAQAASVPVCSGNVYLPNHAAWKQDFEDEVDAFPNYTSDDQVDAMSQIINYCEKNGGLGVWSLYKNRSAA